MLVYCTQDLIFATKIGSTADSLGAPARPARNGEMLRKRLEQVDDGKLNEPVSGVFVDMELGDEAVAMIELVREHSTTLPVVAFGSHVAVEALNRARDAGADRVMARSEFSVNLPEMIRRLSRPDL